MPQGTASVARAWSRRRPASRASTEDEISANQKAGASLLFHGETEYPALLAMVDPAPPVIIARGFLHLFGKPSVGMVGARNASVNGRKMATSLASELGQAGFVVVSGMARGIDTAAHQGALETGTIAVLAGGIDSIYPPENKELYEAIAERGVIISEMPPRKVLPLAMLILLVPCPEFSRCRSRYCHSGAPLRRFRRMRFPPP